MKKVHRSRDRIVAGVLGGLAEYFGHDPVIWRIGFVIFLFVTGIAPGVLLYPIAWMLMPAPSTEVRDAEYTVVE